ncbi:MAG: aldehyde dehydrogenase family protein [Gammaproteobacteria bacterium]|nr:aldehyde dehydrogenase family protein [Gammaproteobacteria bacterium]NNJ96996.1 aldehyde dehydrogenase family protein [Gammaproteobacteria bacterium]
MRKQIQLVSPVDGSIVAERELAGDAEMQTAIGAADAAFDAWKQTGIEQRAALCHKAIDIMRDNAAELAEEITRMMGRPVLHSPGELRGLEQRARYMIGIADQSLADLAIRDDSESVNNPPGYSRFIRHEPLGPVLVLAPWNYPYLTAVNAVIPALMAGNTVILKHSKQTLLCAERFALAFSAAGLPEGAFQFLHLDHHSTAKLVEHPAVRFVSFTGSVSGGKAVERAAAGLFKGVALELGGKDPAYVMRDADLDFSVENLVDGVYFNSGQSCCGVERIYVHQAIYQPFVERFVDAVKQYRLGNPLDADTTLGPMVNDGAAEFVRAQIKQACDSGATACIDAVLFPADRPGSNYLAPQVLVDVDHQMAVMTQESFGPVVGIMKVKDDAQALALMNDSDYGLTASLWTRDDTRAAELGRQLQTGTVFMNRCDYLDPALAWVGVKDSGRGCSLSSLGYQQLTRPKSFYLRQPG